MNSWVKLPIGEIFSIKKGSLQSTKCTPGNYTFITASSEWKTHNDYSHDCEALIYAVAASGSLGRCHHYSGKFITSDLCFILRAKDEKNKPINYRFYQNVFRFLKKDIVAKTKAGTSKESISQKRFSAYTLPYIDIEHQSYWENKLNKLNENIETFDEESINQSTYLTKLRQAILQEAIEGKLTAEWRKENPIRKGDPDYDIQSLLEKIQVEKEKLIKVGKIKKQKTLAPIKAEEVPFELPVGWVWTRLVDIFSFIDYRGKTPTRTDEGVRLISAKNIKFGYIDNKPVEYIAANKYDKWMVRGFPKNGDILFVTEGHTMGFVARIDLDFKYILAQRTICLQPIFYSYSEVVFNFMMSPIFQSIVRDNATGAAATGIKSAKLKNLLIPLPPITEQKFLNKQINNILSMVDELEKQVSERKEQSEQLMQAVLRKAFEGGK